MVIIYHFFIYFDIINIKVRLMKSIYGITLEKLKNYFESIGEKSFKAIQVYEWIYKKRVNSFDEFSNLKKIGSRK